MLKDNMSNNSTAKITDLSLAAEERNAAEVVAYFTKQMTNAGSYPDINDFLSYLAEQSNHETTLLIACERRQKKFVDMKAPTVLIKRDKALQMVHQVRKDAYDFTFSYWREQEALQRQAGRPENNSELIEQFRNMLWTKQNVAKLEAEWVPMAPQIPQKAIDAKVEVYTRLFTYFTEPKTFYQARIDDVKKSVEAHKMTARDLAESTAALKQLGIAPDEPEV